MLLLFCSHLDRYIATPHCGVDLHFPSSSVKRHASVFMWLHGSGLAGHRSTGWLTVGWSNEDGRATGPLGSHHPAGQPWGPGKFWVRRSSQGRWRPHLRSSTASLLVLCDSSASQGQPRFQEWGHKPCYLSMGEAVQSGVKGFGHRQGQRLGGRFAIIIAHQVSCIFHSFFSIYDTHLGNCVP